MRDARDPRKNRGWFRRWTGRIVISTFVALAVAGGGVLLLSDANGVRGASASDGPVPTNIGAFLDSPDLAGSLGQIVFLNDVRIQRGAAGGVLVAEDPAGRSLIVVPKETSLKIEDGQFADVMGTIAPLPPVATMKKIWKLSPEEAKSRQADAVYIDANLVRRKR